MADSNQEAALQLQEMLAQMQAQQSHGQLPVQASYQQQQQNFINQMIQKRNKQWGSQQNNKLVNQKQENSNSQRGTSSASQNGRQQVNYGQSLQLSQQSQSQSVKSSAAGLHTGSLASSTTVKNEGSNFKVQIRVRPPLPREQTGSIFRPIVQVSPDGRSVAIMEYLGQEFDEREKARDIEMNPHLCVWHSYSFDHVYDMPDTQEFVYENTAKVAVGSVLEGYNATILAYGQTGTGKTHTMEGFKYNAGDPSRGIVPRSMEDIFSYIQNKQNMNTTFMVRASYLQIYNEVISDLLKVERTSLQIREDRKKGVFVEGLSEWAVRSPNEIYSLMQKGALSRATAHTKMNDLSSRSHAVFIIIVEQMTSFPDGHGNQDCPKQIKVGKLNLVDLAGSERVRVTGATGKRLEESKKINQSLSCLGNVIAALTDRKPHSHIPYRDSKLTRILEDSLGGNCKTTMMAMVSPSNEAFAESYSTLKFAHRAKKVRNTAKINEDVDQRALLRKYEIELKKLKTELAEKNEAMATGSYAGGGVLNNQNLIKLEAEKRRAEADKNAAITALELRSKEFLQAEQQKNMLEDKIKAMNSQMLVGGKKIEDTPQFRSALQEQQRLIRQEYEGKLNEIERERTQIEEDKAQVDRYKQLLLKQRDIMIALTSRLNERDETIIQLQEELDAYDRIHRETEQVIEFKQMRITQLEDYIEKMCNQSIPMNPYENPDQVRSLIIQPGGFRDNSDHREEKRYVPYHEDQGFNESQSQANHADLDPNQMLTSDEKVQELMQILEAKNLESDEMRVQLEAYQVYNRPQKVTLVQDNSHDIAKYVTQALKEITTGAADNQKLERVSHQLMNLKNIVSGDNQNGQQLQQHERSENPVVQLDGSSHDAERISEGISFGSSVANSIPQSVSEMLKRRSQEKRKLLENYM